VTPRGTDWTLAALVAALAVTGALTLFGGPLVFALHDVTGLALAGVLVYKFRRVWRRVLTRHASLLAATLVIGTLSTGIAWSNAIHPTLLGYNELTWHGALGAALMLAVLTHAFQRAKKPRRRDLTRRQFLTSAAVAAGAVLAWQLTGARRRWTGSFDAGEDFPATSWIADDPAPLASYTLAVGNRRLIAAQLDQGDELTATLDCTGGFYTTRRWRGTRLDRLLDSLEGEHVRVISVTGYRWSFDRADAARLLLATHVDGQPLTHGHGAPARLVAPGHRGFIWVKWVTRIELHDRPDPGAFISTLTSSL
jgi:hypothetical protein